MKLAADAAMFGQALALSSVRDKKAPTLAHLTAGNCAVSISSGDGNITIKTTVAATIFEPGEITVSADRLAALLNAFAPGATALLTANTGSALTIASGNGRYRLPIADAPAALAITGNKVTAIEISAANLLTLLEPLPAAASASRFYLCGLFLHAVADRLCAVATDGVTLLRTSVAVEKPFPGSIVPTSAVTAVMRLVKQTRPERVTLRRSGTLLDVVAPAFTFATRLIDAAYPDYQRIIPAASASTATCTRAELASALARLSAAAGAATPLVALVWIADKPLSIFLPRQPDDGADVVAAQTQGKAQIALSLPALMALVDEFDGESLRLDITEGRALVIRADNKLGMLTFCTWNFQKEAAALIV